MTHRFARIIILLSASLCGDLAASPAMAEAPPTATITATVGTLRNRKGSVQCSLHATGKGFPGGKPLSVAAVTKLGRAAATCVFRAVPPGTYAIAVLHDENNNGKLDTNWLGIPKEGYGASNNKLHTFSAPAFDDSRFVVAKANVALAIRLKY
jgi:uncharacterized protein (DUF2141 family)